MEGLGTGGGDPKGSRLKILVSRAPDDKLGNKACFVCYLVCYLSCFWTLRRPEAGFLNMTDLENNSRITQDSEFANNSRIRRGFFRQKKFEILES